MNILFYRIFSIIQYNKHKHEQRVQNSVQRDLLKYRKILFTLSIYFHRIILFPIKLKFPEYLTFTDRYS